jgi:hypothetical protein
LPQANNVQTVDLDDLNQPQVRTGTRASTAGPAAYKEGQVNLPNQGQVTTVDLDELSPQNTEPPASGEERFSTRLMKDLPGAAGQALLGAGQGLLHTATAPAAYAAGKLFPKAAAPKLAEREQITTPQNARAAIGRGVEQAGEFMLPGLGEERAAALVPEKLAPLARTGYQALTSGGINAAQGGSFGTGAVAGAGTGLLGEGMRAAAPEVAEKALGMRGTDRAFGKTPGRAILDETTGVRPETVAASAKERIGELTPELESKVDAASVRPNRVRGLLPAPPQEIPLGVHPRNPASRPMAFDAAVKPEEPMEPRSGNPLAPISDYPGINPHFLSGSEHPELSGRTPTAQGILIRPQQAPTGPPISPTVPNRVASLGPARGVLNEAAGKATSQNAEGLAGQIGGMQDFLGRRFNTGESIPENVTPRELLNLKRGFSEEHLNWSPDRRDAALSAGRRAYGALDTELDRAVPESAELNQRISSLIPTVRRGEAMARGEGATPRIMERIARPTGALTGAIGGGMLGRQQGGTSGMIEGAGLGLILPELMTSPTGRMVAARALNRPIPQWVLPAIRGGALQLDRGKQ